MKVAYLIADFPKPSETFISREVLALQRLGLDVQPFAFHQPDRADEDQLDAATRGLIPHVEYITRKTVLGEALRSWAPMARVWSENARLQRVSTCKSSGHLMLLRAVRLAKELSAAGIRHLHAHWPYAGKIAYLVNRLTGLPFSVSIHSHEVEYDAGHWPTIFETLSFAAFCNRAAMERLLTKLPTWAQERSHLIYHGVDLEKFAPLPLPPAGAALQVISAGRFTRTKGFDRLIRACARFHKSGGNVELTILGQGGLREELIATAQEMGFASRLHLLGWLPHDQVAARLTASHVFALMADTEYGDGLPNVVLEAMATGRPVILAPLPAAGEAVTDGAEGFILDSATDEAGCVSALRQCVADFAKLQAMGKAARLRVERTFDEATHAKRLKRLFEATGEGLLASTPHATAQVSS